MGLIDERILLRAMDDDDHDDDLKGKHRTNRHSGMNDQDRMYYNDGVDSIDDDEYRKV